MEEEVELRDYINVLLKWKKLIIGITIFAMLAAGIISYFVIQPTYKGSATVMLPVVGDEQLLSSNNIIVKEQLLSSDEAQALIKSDSFAEVVAKKTSIPYYEVINGINVSALKNASFISIYFENHNRKKITEFFNILIPTLNDQYPTFYQKLNAIKSKLLVLNNELELLTKQENTISANIKQITKDGTYKSSSLEDTLEYSLLYNAYDSIISKKISVEQQIADLQSHLSMSHGFDYITSPVVPTQPVKPKKLFNIAVAGVAAFFFAILLAFFLEYWYGSEEDHKKEGAV